MDHTQLSTFPNRTEPFFGTLLGELHDLLDVHDNEETPPDTELEDMVSCLNLSLVSSPDNVDVFSESLGGAGLNSLLPAIRKVFNRVLLQVSVLHRTLEQQTLRPR